MVGFEDYADVVSFWVEMGVAVVADVAWGAGVDGVVAALERLLGWCFGRESIGGYGYHEAILAGKPEGSALFKENVAGDYVFSPGFLRSQTFSWTIFGSVCATLSFC